MIRKIEDRDIETVYTIINSAAHRYRGVIPEDRWKEPYMPIDELNHEIDSGVVFFCHESGDTITGVMGIQDVQDVTLIRHAYVMPEKQNFGIGGKLLKHLLELADKPVLIGTWADADWAIGFYEKHGFTLTTEEEKTRLLKKYWSISQRQVETSVVLASDASFLQK
jgi:GNAT superfamily N-acetyltransferase